MHMVNLDTKSILKYLNENTFLPDDCAVKSHKLRKRAADSRDLFRRSAVFTYLSENNVQASRIRQMDWRIPGVVCAFSLAVCAPRSW